MEKFEKREIEDRRKKKEQESAEAISGLKIKYYENNTALSKSMQDY